MTIRWNAVAYIGLALFGALGLQTGLASPVSAQQSTNPNTKATEPWTLEHALPTRRTDDAPARGRKVPDATPRSFGRIPLESGTFGFETQTKFKANELPDGRELPGLANSSSRKPNYFGLSLSVPTNDPPPLRLFGRPD